MKRLILILLFLFLFKSLFCQSVSFTYDDSGNRLNRSISVQQLKSNKVQLPGADTENLNMPEKIKLEEKEKVSKEAISSENRDVNLLVYPNPNKGFIKMDILNMPLNSVNEIKLYDLSGLELKVLKNSDSHTEIDISQFQDGIYILKIKVVDKVFDYKIVTKH